MIEKAQVDAELMDLTRLRSAHAEEQYRIRRNLRHAHEEAETFTVRLTNLRQDIVARQDTSGDNFRIELDGGLSTTGVLLENCCSGAQRNFATASAKTCAWAGLPVLTCSSGPA